MTEKIDFSKIKAVFLDAGGTLFQPHPSVGEIYASVAAEHNLYVMPDYIEERFHELWAERDGLASLTAHSGEKEEKAWWRKLVFDVFSEIGDMNGFDKFFEELYDRFACAEAWRLFPDAVPLLQELNRRGKTVGIVSNWDSRLFGICEGLGIQPYLNFILASAVVGAAKPNPKIFQEALKRAGAAPGEALHVGDSLEDDIRGAQGVGIQAVFLDRKGNRPPHDLTISTLQFLCGLFEN
jgi:putative hydrolase of the HAD superfamily